MRNAFISSLFKNAQKNNKIMLITGDLGFSVFEGYMEKLPNQFLNAGVAEQNMTGIAAGMALEGKIPIIYSIIPFVTMRNFEQLRNDICYPNLNVKIVGVGAGFSYGMYGYTHYAIDDITIMSALPNLTIFSPSDPLEARVLTDRALKMKSPVYIRLAKAGEPNLHKTVSEIGKNGGYIYKQGKDIAIVTTGTMLKTAIEVAEILENNNISTMVVEVYALKPFNSKVIIDAAKKVKKVVSLEEHILIGGLGNKIAQVLAEECQGKPFKQIGIVNLNTKKVGSQQYMQNHHGLSVEKIVEAISSFKL